MARLIDLRHLGTERVIGTWVVGDVIVDPGPSSCLPTLLEALGDERPRTVLLTHIHLDHAGVTGSLVKRWPDIQVYVHQRGAVHMIEPARLIESATRLYGDDMDRLWGEFLAVPQDNVHVLHGGETLLDGRFEVIYTPGHASHHVCYLNEGIAFVGDVGGVRIASGSLTFPPTPPPDIDIEAWHESIDKVRVWQPKRLAMTHFGAGDEVQEQLTELDARLDEWAARARGAEQDEFIDWVNAEIAAASDPSLKDAYRQAAPPEQLYAGLTRYWRKRAEAESAPARS